MVESQEKSFTTYLSISCGWSRSLEHAVPSYQSNKQIAVPRNLFNTTETLNENMLKYLDKDDLLKRDYRL